MYAASAGFRSLEDDWRQQCRHFASIQDLSHVQEMRIAHIVSSSACPCLRSLVVWRNRSTLQLNVMQTQWAIDKMLSSPRILPIQHTHPACMIWHHQGAYVDDPPIDAELVGLLASC